MRTLLKRKLLEQLSFEIEFVRNEKYVRQTVAFLILDVTRFEGAACPHNEQDFASIKGIRAYF